MRGSQVIPIGRPDRLRWLPPGVVRGAAHMVPGPPEDDSPTRAVVLAALRDAPPGPVLAIRCDNPETPFEVAGRNVQTILADKVPTSDTGDAPVAGCVLLASLERVEHPASLLASAYERLVSGGVLVVVVHEPSRTIPASAPATHLFPGETVAALLYHAGFERPRFYRRGNYVITTARRSDAAPPWCRTQRLSVILPAYNEKETFSKTMDRLLGKQIDGVDIDVIVVESNSTDGTRDEVLAYANTPGVQIILEDRPHGKGHAVRRGLEAATGDFVLIQDADLEYDMDDYETLLQPLMRCEVGFVLGMRTSPDGAWGMRRFGQDTTMSHFINFGHELFLALFNFVYGQKLQDPFTMYKVFRRDCLEGLTLECNRFDFDWELTAKLIRSGYRPLELPVSYVSRSFSEGKKVTLIRDPLTWIRACLRYRFSKLHSYS